MAVFSALKGDKGLGQNIRAQATTDTSSKKLLTFDECHHGGFGKFSPALFHFLSDMHRLNPALTLDPVYTGKMLFRVWQLAATGRWPYQSTLFIHTGGVQGWRGVPRDLWPYNVMGN